MKDSRRVTAIVGSYRRGGIIYKVIDELLESAKEEGAATRKIYLIQQRIEFLCQLPGLHPAGGARMGLGGLS